MTLSRSARFGLTAAALTAGLTAAAGPGFAVAGAGKVQDIFVTNGDSAPVPTKAIGTTKVDATGQTLTINGTADVSGSRVDATGSKVDATGSTVTIDGEVPVRVTNPAADAAERTPFQQEFVIPLSANVPEPLLGLVGSKVLREQSAGERLVITNVAGGGTEAQDALVMFRLSDFCQGQPRISSLPVALSVQPEGAYPAFNQPVHYEIAPEHCLSAELRYANRSADGLAQYPVMISGYTVSE